MDKAYKDQALGVSPLPNASVETKTAIHVKKRPHASAMIPASSRLEFRMQEQTIQRQALRAIVGAASLAVLIAGCSTLNQGLASGPTLSGVVSVGGPLSNAIVTVADVPMIDIEAKTITFANAHEAD